MNVLIVYSHPSRKSFTYQVLKNIIRGLEYSNHRISVSDLYQMDFQTDITEYEYQREGFARIERPLPDDVVAEHRKIQQSDCIIFIYPVWWSDCPAKMKGWFDRVFSVGYAYGYDIRGNQQITMKKLKLGLVVCPAGHPNELLEETGLAESMRKVMLEDRLGVRFENKEMIILGGTLEFEKVKEKHLEKAFEIGQHITDFMT